MIVNWVCRKQSAGSEIRLAYRESMIALSIIKSRSCGSKLNSVRLIIQRPGVLVLPVVLVGLQSLLEMDGQIRLPKLDSRYPAPVPRPTGTTLDHRSQSNESEIDLPETIRRFGRPAANRESMNSPAISHHTSNSSGWCSQFTTEFNSLYFGGGTGGTRGNGGT
jgi:hypothetical protein